MTSTRQRRGPTPDSRHHGRHSRVVGRCCLRQQWMESMAAAVTASWLDMLLAGHYMTLEEHYIRKCWRRHKAAVAVGGALCSTSTNIWLYSVDSAHHPPSPVSSLVSSPVSSPMSYPVSSPVSSSTQHTQVDIIWGFLCALKPACYYLGSVCFNPIYVAQLDGFTPNGGTIQRGW